MGALKKFLLGKCPAITSENLYAPCECHTASFIQSIGKCVGWMCWWAHVYHDAAGENSASRGKFSEMENCVKKKESSTHTPSTYDLVLLEMWNRSTRVSASVSFATSVSELKSHNLLPEVPRRNFCSNNYANDSDNNIINKIKPKCSCLSLRLVSVDACVCESESCLRK